MLQGHLFCSWLPIKVYMVFHFWIVIWYENEALLVFLWKWKFPKVMITSVLYGTLIQHGFVRCSAVYEKEHSVSCIKSYILTQPQIHLFISKSGLSCALQNTELLSTNHEAKRRFPKIDRIWLLYWQIIIPWNCLKNRTFNVLEKHSNNVYPPTSLCRRY